MKLSDIEQLFSEYAEAKWSPSRMGVHLGCDCGCGGDSYTIDTWEAEENSAQESIDNMKAFCIKYNFDYDGIE